jgi:hypothetical protein
LIEEQLERGIENFLLAATKLTDLTRFFMHKKRSVGGQNSKPRIMPNLRKNARIIQPYMCFVMNSASLAD